MIINNKLPYEHNLMKSSLGGIELKLNDNKSQTKRLNNDCDNTKNRKKIQESLKCLRIL